MALGIGTLWAVLAAMAASMVVGFIWYGPIWSKQYMRLTGMEGMSEEAKRAGQKEAVEVHPGFWFVQRECPTPLILARAPQDPAVVLQGE
jgi:hypothetical protein